MQKPLVLISLIVLAGAALYLLRAPEPPRQPAAESAPPATIAVPAPAAEESIPRARVLDDTLRPARRQPEAPRATASTVGVDGWVGDASGNGLGDIVIEIESHGFDGEQTAAFTTRSNQRGEFSFRQLLPERQYRLNIKPQRDYAAFSIDSFTAETAEALQGIVLERIDLVGADGMIVDTDGAPVADFELSVRSLAAEFPDRVIKSDASGYFRLENFPAGELRIATNASDYYRIKGLVLRPDEYRNLTLIIDKGSYYLSGLVSDRNGAPVQQAQVTLKSAFATGEYHSYSYRSTATDANGRFEFSGLGGKQLTLGIYAAGYKTRIQRHDFVSFSDRVEIVLDAEL